MSDQKYNLFLDDVRHPKLNCAYMNNKIYDELDWVIVKTYDEFVKHVSENGLPELVSFDHDLADEHYTNDMYKGVDVYEKHYENFQEKTGKHCAVWMADYCMDNGKSFPNWIVHSMNPSGKILIESYISNYLKHIEGK
jgi:hypothetical protein